MTLFWDDAYLAHEPPAGEFEAEWTGRLALVQEGGYQISHLAYATLGVLEGVVRVSTGVADPFDWLDGDVSSARHAIDEAVAHHAEHWGL